MQKQLLRGDVKKAVVLGDSTFVATLFSSFDGLRSLSKARGTYLVILLSWRQISMSLDKNW